MFLLGYVPSAPASPVAITDQFPGPALRRRVRRDALELDWALAGGAHPTQSGELLLRAEQLLQARERERLAKSIERLVRLVDQGSKKKLRIKQDGKRTRVRIRGKKIWATRPLLVELTERLREEQRPPLRGVAMASALLSDSTGPLYDSDQSRRLQRAAQATLSLLQEERAFVRR